MSAVYATLREDGFNAISSNTTFHSNAEVSDVGSFRLKEASYGVCFEVSGADRMTIGDAPYLEMRHAHFSAGALAEYKFHQLAGTAAAGDGALVACGCVAPATAAHLANLGLSAQRPFYLAPLPGEPRDSVEALRADINRRGYYCHYMYIEPPEEIPERISFLSLNGRSPEAIRVSLKWLYPRVANSGIVVVQGPAECHERLLDFGAQSGKKPFGNYELGEQSCTWWTKDSESEAALKNENAASVDECTEASGKVVILGFPNRIRGKFAKMCRLAGYQTTNDPTRGFDFAIKWNGETYTPRCRMLAELSDQTRVLNINCEDISKTCVEEMHRAVFGYGLIVDPRRYHGLCVKKADLNAQCSESVVECPVAERQHGFVYQRMIRTAGEPDEFEEYRVPVTGTEIPCVVIKRRSLEERFNRCAGYAEIAKADELFTSAELENIFQLTRRMGLEFGDLDILRDVRDGRIHVIDVNPTPGGPGGPGYGYTAEQGDEIIARQLEAFQRIYLHHRQ